MLIKTWFCSGDAGVRTCHCISTTWKVTESTRVDLFCLLPAPLLGGYLSVSLIVDGIFTLFVIFLVHIKLRRPRGKFEAFLLCSSCGACPLKRARTTYTYACTWRRTLHTHSYIGNNLQQEYESPDGGWKW